MKKIILLMAGLFLLNGCTGMSYTHRTADGDKITARYFTSSLSGKKSIGHLLLKGDKDGKSLEINDLKKEENSGDFTKMLMESYIKNSIKPVPTP